MVKFRNVSFSYNTDGTGVESLSQIDLTIREGECVVLCGASGCGKTSIIRLINGLIPTYYNGELSGEVTIDNENVSQMAFYQIAKKVGSVFQNPKSQFFNNDVESELSFVCENLGFEQSEIDQRVASAVRTFSVENLINKEVKALSGGEKQKIACACVSAPNPDIFVFDEPSANLDEKGICLLQNALSDLKKQTKTMIIAEHRLFYLNDVADRYIYIDKGRISASYSKDEFLALSSEQRIAMGLRSINKTIVNTTAWHNECSDNIHFKNFCYRYHKSASLKLNIKSLILPKNSIVAITGHNGAGKSTFANCICGIYKKTGEMLLNGQSFKAKQRLERCYLVMQDSNRQLFTESVLDEVQLGKKGHSREQTILQSVNLLDVKERHPVSLSGGQKQRLSIATAISSNREVIVFDEPTSGLDYTNMIAVAELLKKLKQTTTSIVVITHDMELVSQCADYIIELENGEIKSKYKKAF